MKKYAKKTGEHTYEVGLGTNAAFYESLGMTLTDVEQGVDGNWYDPGFAPTEPPKEELLDALTAEYRAEKANLCEAYTTASMQGDTETAQSVAADMADLDAWYDEEYKAIEEGSADNG